MTDITERLRNAANDGEPHWQLLDEASDIIEEIDKRIAELTAVIQQVDALIQYQFTGRRCAMDALQRVTFAAHAALGHPE